MPCLRGLIQPPVARRRHSQAKRGLNAARNAALQAGARYRLREGESGEGEGESGEGGGGGEGGGVGGEGGGGLGDGGSSEGGGGLCSRSCWPTSAASWAGW